MFKTIDRYILSECIPTFAISLAAFSFVLLIHRMVKLFDLVLSKGVPVWDAVKLFLLAVPTLLPILLPISLLLAVLLSMGRLSSDGEIVAMRASGIGLVSNLRPIFVFSLGVTTLALVVSLFIQPQGARMFRQTLFDALIKRINVSAQAGTFSRLSDNITIYADAVDEESGKIDGLLLHTKGNGLADSVIMAKSGKLYATEGGISLELEEAQMFRMTGGKKSAQKTSAQKSRIIIPMPTIGETESTPEEKLTGELISLGYTNGSDKDMRMEFNRRLALPFSCLILGLLGASMGTDHGRTGKSRGFGLSLAILLAYYGLLTTSKVLGRQGVLGPELAMWMPNIVLFALAAYTFTRKNRERPLPFEQAFADAFDKAKTLFGRASA